MKYCMFCRDSFEDEEKVCPRCGGELTSEPDKEIGEDGASGEPDKEIRDEGMSGDEIEDEPEPDPRMQEDLVPVVVVKNADDLRAATEVLTEHGINFEIDSADGRQYYGIALGRPAWRILVKPDQGPEAFLRLAEALPDLFPHEVSEALEKEHEEHPDEAALAAERVVEILESPGVVASGAELAKNIVTALSGGDSVSIARAQYALARRAADVAPLLSLIAEQAVAEGGGGAERVLYNVLEVLEALGDTAPLAKIEELFESPTAQIRARAAYAAGRLGAPAAVDGLIDLMSDSDEEVRYEASEAVWRLTGFDFDFDAYLSPEQEKGHVEALRSEWERSGKKGLVRNKMDLATLLRAIVD